MCQRYIYLQKCTILKKNEWNKSQLKIDPSLVFSLKNSFYPSVCYQKLDNSDKISEKLESRRISAFYLTNQKYKYFYLSLVSKAGSGRADIWPIRAKMTMLPTDNIFTSIWNLQGTSLCLLTHSCHFMD